MLDTPEAKEIFKTCNRFLTHDYPKTPRQVLSELAEMTDPELEADRYGQGDVITHFESEVAALLGKEAPIFLPGFTMFELTVGEATLDLSDQEIDALFQMLLTRVSV